MFTPIIRMAAAVLIAGTVAFAVSAAPAANGREIKENSARPLVKAGQLRVTLTGAGCSLHGWPDYETKCQFDVRQADGNARIVRVLAPR